MRLVIFRAGCISSRGIQNGAAAGEIRSFFSYLAIIV